ncbi:MAG: DUF1269 domain-containing protein [Myxococcales bacterium]|nr:DUF1269 domain-containing protein [Myxococcales bacterium]
MPEKDPRSLVVLTFDSQLKAQEALLAFQRLQAEEVLLVHDAVFILRDQAGATRVVETVDTPPSSAAMSGGLWGALLGTLVAGPIGTVVGGAISAGLGALSAKLIDIGIPDATIKELEEAATPGSTSLALLLSHVREESLEKELERFRGAHLTQSTLAPDTVMRLRSALRKPAESDGER